MDSRHSASRDKLAQIVLNAKRVGVCEALGTVPSMTAGTL